MIPIDLLNAFIAGVVSSPWVLVLIAVVVFIDAFFPPVPSESIVIAAAAAAVSVGEPNIVLVVACAAIGAIAGDNLTFWIGRAVGLERFAWMRRPRMRRALRSASNGIARRPAPFLMTARYVPVGRVAVNLVAGASGFPRRRFLPLSIIAGVTWAVYSVAIGLLAGHLLHGNALLGMLVGVAGGIASGVIVDLVMRLSSRLHARRGMRRTGTADSVAEVEATTGPQPTEYVGAE
ncbi:DedA family protein [Humibacter albus]|uniref:DedA family protein n=1 Tax=Humibacter albus TaxID=427754 RepID=UPI0003B63DA0|nr:VTT domain-containing protein [Humibacter albus]